MEQGGEASEWIQESLQELTAFASGLGMIVMGRGAHGEELAPGPVDG